MLRPLAATPDRWGEMTENSFVRQVGGVRREWRRPVLTRLDLNETAAGAIATNTENDDSFPPSV